MLGSLSLVKFHVWFVDLFEVVTMCTVPSVFKCRTVRAISSDRGKVVSGSDDHSVLVWDKQTTQLLEELNGHDGPVFLFKIILVCSTTESICDVNYLLIYKMER